MPSKVQLKLLSNAGELLSLVTCHAGKISVLRAGSPSDLRPYQRALGGSSAKDNLEIVCDGAEYRPDLHTLIGFGEPSPTAGLSVKQFLTGQGVSELATDSLLLSIGLESIAQKQCSELSPDQEARLRLVAATMNPDKILVLNDPFEHIASQWRERAADTLSAYARSRKALIIIPALSYRPECWIDNDCIERIEVGQTSQRTIGFGSAGSQSNAMVEDIRAKLRQDPRFAGESDSDHKRGLAAAAGIAAGMRVEDLGETGVPAKTSMLPSLLKVASVAVGVAAGGWLAVSFSNFSPTTPKSPQQVAAINKQVPSAVAPAVEKKQEPVSAPPDQGKQAPPDPARLVSQPKEPTVEYVLDTYPTVIKASLLDTSRGLSGFSPTESTKDSATSAKEAPNAGNLFSLLETASSKKPDPSDIAQPWAGMDSQHDADSAPEAAVADPSDEQERREAIRKRFLEAIQAAAARREAAAQEDRDEQED